MKRVANVDPSVLKQHYEKKVHELEHEKKALQVVLDLSFVVHDSIIFSCFLIYVVNYQKEIEELRYNLENMSSTSDEGAQKLKEDYLQKLNVLESQVNLHFVCSSYQDYLLASIFV